MLGLPSTTAVGRRMPKELFYRNLSLPADVKRAFVDDVERIELAHSIRSATTGIPDGVGVHEVLVIEVALKERKVPEGALSCIARTNQHKLLFVCTYGEEACLAVMLKELIVGPWCRADGLTLEVNAGSMDLVWDSIASQVAYGDAGDGERTVEERFAEDAKLKELRDELVRVEARGRKERQFARKNALFDRAKELKWQIAVIEKGSVR